MTGTVSLRLAELTGAGVGAVRPLGGHHGARHYHVTLADGREVFVKAAGASAAALRAEAHGLRWLGEARAVPVPDVVACDDELLVVSWVRTAAPDVGSAQTFGRDLARLHTTGARAFGAPWEGFIASLPLPNDPGVSWPDWYAAQRVVPYLRMAVDSGELSGADAVLVESALARAGALAGPAELPSRIHGDCWSGNVLWSGGRGWLIDPAAHGGHRETDLAMLALFGAPYLDQVIGAYQDVAPLAAGWRQRVPLHQLHPLLVHVCLFGSSYRESVLGAARAVLAC
ncbi:MAG TPA: fructosamine kinase family protein [Streptosporangiaceae bacterium]|nr:fructosamine kinase family protein [Streptosporangiaceae bacterium]